MPPEEVTVARRSIYSTRQSSPSTYDTSFADFLDSIPQLVGQYQQNQLALEKQRLVNKRYNDSIERQKKQTEFKNELDLINLIPDYLRSSVMQSSDNSKVRDLGNQISIQDNLIEEALNPKEEKEIDYYSELKNNPSIANNKTRLKQIDNKIAKIKEKNYIASIEKFIKENPKDPRVPFIESTYKLEPERTLQSLVPRREATKSADSFSPAQLKELYENTLEAAKSIRGTDPEGFARLKKKADEILTYRLSLVDVPFSDLPKNTNLNSSEVDSTRVVKIPVEY